MSPILEPDDVLVVLLLYITCSRDPPTVQVPDDLLEFCYSTIEACETPHILGVETGAPAPWLLQTLKHSSLLTTASLMADHLRAPEQFSSVLISACEDVLKSGSIRPSSFVGASIRNTSLKAKQMSFTKLLQFLEHWRTYVEELRNNLREIRESEVGLRQEAQRGTLTVLTLPRREAEVFVCRSVIHPSTERGYTNFQTAWRRGDYASSLAQLSRLFDYAIPSEGVFSYQYALLHVALLQDDFQCYKESLWALYETIDAARDNHDEDCLALAWSWLRGMSGKQRSHTHRPEPISSDGGIYANLGQQGLDFQSPSIERMCLSLVKVPSEGLGLLFLLKSLGTASKFRLVINTQQFRIQAQLWDQFDILELSKLALRLGMTFCGKDDDEFVTQMQCDVSQCYQELGNTDQARSILLDILKTPSLNYNCARICRTRLALSDLNQGSSQIEDEFLEQQQIDRAPITAVSAIRRAILARNLPSAWAMNEHFLTPSVHCKRVRSAQQEVAHLRLKSQILRASLEVDKSIIVASKAMLIAHQHALYKELRVMKKDFAIQSM